MAAKRTAKKAAAKREDPLGEFPLPQGHYLHPPVVSPSAHSGYDEKWRHAIVLVQGAVGAAKTGVYDEQTADAVRAWRSQRGLDSSLVIDEQAWAALREG